MLNITHNEFSERIHSKYKIFRNAKNIPNFIFLRNIFPEILNRIFINYAFNLKNILNFQFYLKNISKENHIFNDKIIRLKEYILISGEIIKMLFKNRKLILNHNSPYSTAQQSLLHKFKPNKEYYNAIPILLKDNLLSITTFNNINVAHKLNYLRKYNINGNQIFNTNPYKYKHVISFKQGNFLSLNLNKNLQNSYMNLNYQINKNEFQKKKIERLPVNKIFIINSDNYKQYRNFKKQNESEYSPINSFYFHNQQKIEHEVEKIKKAMFETKEAFRQINHYSPRDIKMAIKQYVDINHISDQVYQNIERRIRLERERRGLT